MGIAGHKGEEGKMRRHGTREQDLTQMLIAVCVAAFLAVILCKAIPGIQKNEIIEFFVGFWVIGTIAVWTIIDLIIRKWEDWSCR